MLNESSIAVVIPCYKVGSQLRGVVKKIPAFVSWIIAVDDACPENSLAAIENLNDPRLVRMRHKANKGVGGAMVTGYRKAIELKADVCVKIDGDGQMDPALIGRFVSPILQGKADYTKGNRFYYYKYVSEMPFGRRIGNMASSFFTKISTGYWHLFDSNNGYVCIHLKLFDVISLEELSERFFFETSMLYNLNLVDACVVDVPMKAVYHPENRSNLSFLKNFVPFFFSYQKNFFKRILYKYFSRDFNYGSIQLAFGILLSCAGTSFGFYKWYVNHVANTDSTAGEAVIFSVLFLSGLQFLFGFINYDINSTPKIPVNSSID